MGELCLAGFAIEDVADPMHAKDDTAAGSFGDRSRFVAPYIRFKARRRVDVPAPPETRRLWLGGES
ncbi:MAG: hypothetical protein QM811_15590 [Pirellulales bacterium]